MANMYNTLKMSNMTYMLNMQNMKSPLAYATPLLHMHPPCFNITNMQQICKICQEYEPPLFLYAKKYKI
jgi:hypothetical protein